LSLSHVQSLQTDLSLRPYAQIQEPKVWCESVSDLRFWAGSLKIRQTFAI
jgi:hypothetical protein